MPRANWEDAMIVTITRDGKVYVGHEQVERERLSPIIRDHWTAGGERKVYMRVDSNTKYAILMRVLPEVHAAGVDIIGFLVKYHPPSI